MTGWYHGMSLWAVTVSFIHMKSAFFTHPTESGIVFLHQKASFSTVPNRINYSPGQTYLGDSLGQWQQQWNSLFSVFKISQTSASFNTTLLLLLLIRLMPPGQRWQGVHPPPLIMLCADQELLLSSTWLSHLKRRRRLRDRAEVVFVCPPPASLFSLVNRWIEAKQEDMRALFVMHKQEVARLAGRRGGGELSAKGDAVAGSMPISILLHSAM